MSTGSAQDWSNRLAAWDFEPVHDAFASFTDGPFGGLMTVPMMALRMGRRGRGVELNPGYWADGVKYLEAEERSQNIPTLFDLGEPA